MEILFVSHKYPPSTGGMQKQSFELITGMRCHAKVYTLINDGSVSTFRFFVSLKKRMNEMCVQHPGISVIHYNDGLMAAFCLAFKKHPHIKRTATLHGLDVVFPNRIYQRYILPKFNRFSLLIAVSRATAQKAVERGIAPAKIITIPNGVDTGIKPLPITEEFGRQLLRHGINPQTQKIIMALGRSVKRKGFSWFIKNVLPLLPADTVFIMAGPFTPKPGPTEKILNLLPAFLSKQIEFSTGFPEDEKVIRNLLAQPEFKNRAWHLGKLSFNHIQQLLSTARAFVMPNIAVLGDMEGFGLVCLEACLCGTTVFASAIDGITEAIIEGKNGHLLPTGNAGQWANVLNDHLTHPEKYALTHARDFTIDNYNWEIMVQRYFEAFKKLV